MELENAPLGLKSSRFAMLAIRKKAQRKWRRGSSAIYFSELKLCCIRTVQIEAEHSTILTDTTSVINKSQHGKSDQAHGGAALYWSE